MPVIGVTGGVATGKSTFSALLAEFIGAHVFNADVAARELVDSHPEVQQELRRQFGDDVFLESGGLNRRQLRAIVFADETRKRALELILHPRIRHLWAAGAERARAAGENFIADIPLLYETAGEALCDHVVVVACSPDVQLQRLMARARLTAPAAQQMIDSQMPLSEKTKRADHVAWNNGGIDVLRAQAQILGASWRKNS